MSQKNQDNQTSFSQEAPLFDDLTNIPVPQKEQPVSSKSNRPKVLLLVGVGLLVVTLLLLVLFILARPKVSPQVTTPQEEETQEVGSSLSPIQLRIEEARQDLRLADPAADVLPLPPVSIQIDLTNQNAR